MHNYYYNIDFGRLILWNLPHKLRRLHIINWLVSLVYPIVQNHQAFLRYRKAKLYRLSITPQVCYIEKMLNDRFDFTLRRIRLVDPVWHDPIYLYQDGELKDVFIYQDSENLPAFVYTDAEAGESTVDGVVQVPAGLIFNVDEMRSLVDIYKIFGVKYKIEIV